MKLTKELKENIDLYLKTKTPKELLHLFKKYGIEEIPKQLILSGVGSSLPTKKYEIDFGTHLRCGIDVTNNELNILGAMDGWGNGVSKDVIVIKEL